MFDVGLEKWTSRFVKERRKRSTCCQLSFVSQRRQHSKCRMRSLSIVIHDPILCLINGFKNARKTSTRPQNFTFDCVPKRLGNGIIPTLSFPTHACSHLSLTQALLKRMSAILTALIGMENGAGQNSASTRLQCHLEGSFNQFNRNRCTQCPSH